MKYRNMKTGQERDFVQGMKIDPLWRPVNVFSQGPATVSIVEVHPEDIDRIDKKAEEISNPESSMTKSVTAKNVELAKKKAAREKNATEAEIVEESI